MEPQKFLEKKRDENIFARFWLQIKELTNKNDIGLDIRSSKRKKTENVRLKEYVVEAKTSATEGFQEILEESSLDSSVGNFAS